MSKVWTWLLKNGPILVLVGELAYEVGKAVRNSLKPEEPKTEEG